MSFPKPSPALVVAMVALFVALGGTTIAAVAMVNGDKLIKKGTLSGNRLRKQTITGVQVNLRKLGKVPRAGLADRATTATSATSATNAANATNATNAANATNATNAANATNAGHATNADKLGGNLPSAFVSNCNDGSVTAVGSWYVSALPSDPTFVAPHRYGGEGGFACNGATPELTKEGTGFYRMKFTQELPNQASYAAFINPDARGATPLYGDANDILAVGSSSVWDIHVFDKTGAPADPYYIEVLLVKLS
jgi:hypothetical protein